MIDDLVKRLVERLEESLDIGLTIPQEEIIALYLEKAYARGRLDQVEDYGY